MIANSQIVFRAGATVLPAIGGKYVG